MSQANLIELNIPAADLAEIKTALNILTAKLAPHLITLSTSDRQELPSRLLKNYLTRFGRVNFGQKILIYSV